MWQRPSGGLTCQPATTATPGNITGEALAEKKPFYIFSNLSVYYYTVETIIKQYLTL